MKQSRRMFAAKGMGWLPDMPDPRDFTFRHSEVLRLLRQLQPYPESTPPAEQDLRQDSEGVYFTEPWDQGNLNSSSAFAILSLVEYFERRTRGRTFNGSPLFLYKVTRNQLSRSSCPVGDVGADLRSTLKTLVRFGVPERDQLAYLEDAFDEEPSAFLYALANRFPKIRYFRIDEQNTNGKTTYAVLKSFLTSGFPVAFGFPVPDSISNDANIPYRPGFDRACRGQSVVAVGYRENHFGTRQDGILIRSSWGSQWGDNGNGWLPVACILHQNARDFWTLISEDWLNSGELYCPSIIESLEGSSGFP